MWYYAHMPTHTTIIVKDEKMLRARAREVPLADIGTPEIKKLIADMSAVLAREEDGVALAAPQIGESLRLFVISGKILARLNKKQVKLENAVFINPVLLKSSQKKQTVEEGCLSLRWFYGKVRRAARVTLEAHDAEGKKFTKTASGLLAQIFQHEMDHLDGALFIDKAKDIINIPPTTNYKQDTKIRT